MGLDTNGVRFVLYAKCLGVDFRRTATIGRQGLHLRRQALARCLSEFGCVPKEAVVDAIFSTATGFADDLLRRLGADDIHSFDISPFEGATHIHDMNREIPSGFRNAYSVVLDGGSLEHVFHFPTALKNCLEMVGVGGHYLAITPTNNFSGHGFYQLSPEVYFSALTPDNGFDIVTIIAFEDFPDSTWYAVRNPRDVAGRVNLVNGRPTYLLIAARKTHRADIFARVPQQSDYVVAWRDGSHAGGRPTRLAVPSVGRRLADRLGRLEPAMPRLLANVSGALRNWLSSGFDARLFEPLTPSDAATSCPIRLDL